MIKTDLIEIINSGKAWAFVGSGVSADAGGPTWEVLVNQIISKIPDEKKEVIQSQTKFIRASEKKDFPRCLSVIESNIGRDELEKYVRRELSTMKDFSGRLAQRIADLPFNAYLTTNYDHLLEKALDEKKSRGWVSIGNTEDEARKVSRDAEKIIWHIHGSIEMPSDKSRLILTEEDYESIYLEQSKMFDQLKGVLSQHRIVFIGFSFQDAGANRLLKIVGKLCTPDRPAFAFLSDISEKEHEEERKDLLIKYNIVVIPYKTITGSHKRLHDLLDVYESMILKRSQRFGNPHRVAPSYDEEATGLLLYNELHLSRREAFSDSISASLLRARILSVLRFRNSIGIDEIKSELRERVRLLQSGTIDYREIDEQIESVISELINGNLIEYNKDDSTMCLSKEGNELASDKKAISERLNDQLYSSLNSRTLKILEDNSGIARKITDTAISFLKESIKKHSLGVALAQDSSNKHHQEFQILALLQSLPEFMGQLSSSEEAKVFIQLIQDILSSPNSTEKKCIGFLLQAQFGVHLLGYNPSTLRIRAENVQKTLFLIDSSTLIPYLARSCTGHESAAKAIKLMKDCGATIVTTDLLAWETSEHANWAIKHSGQSVQSMESLNASMGQIGPRSNAFLEGFLEEVEKGTIPPSLNEYLSQVCGKSKNTEICRDLDVINTLRFSDIPSLSFDQWDGFDETLFSERDTIKSKIAERRIQNGSYNHPRQVQAEAEALLIIKNLREGSLKYDDKEIASAYFVSNTRIIDQIDGGKLSITIADEAVESWLSTIGYVDPLELGFLYDGLLWELHDKGFSIIDRSRMKNVFAPLISIRKEELQGLIEQNRAMISETYGADAEKAFSEADDLLVPNIVESIATSKAQQLEKQLNAEKKERIEAQKRAAMADKDRAELERLRVKDRKRQAKAKSRKRSAESRPKKGKKKKKK